MKRSLSGASSSLTSSAERDLTFVVPAFPVTPERAGRGGHRLILSAPFRREYGTVKGVTGMEIGVENLSKTFESSQRTVTAPHTLSVDVPGRTVSTLPGP